MGISPPFFLPNNSVLLFPHIVVSTKTKSSNLIINPTSINDRKPRIAEGHRDP